MGYINKAKCEQGALCCAAKLSTKDKSYGRPQIRASSGLRRAENKAKQAFEGKKSGGPRRCTMGQRAGAITAQVLVKPWFCQDDMKIDEFVHGTNSVTTEAPV